MPRRTGKLQTHGTLPAITGRGYVVRLQAPPACLLLPHRAVCVRMCCVCTALQDACPTFTYIPGAGDDEESWAHGLTPALLAQHQMVGAAALPGSAAPPAAAAHRWEKARSAS